MAWTHILHGLLWRSFNLEGMVVTYGAILGIRGTISAQWLDVMMMNRFSNPIILQNVRHLPSWTRFLRSATSMKLGTIIMPTSTCHYDTTQLTSPWMFRSGSTALRGCVFQGNQTPWQWISYHCRWWQLCCTNLVVQSLRGQGKASATWSQEMGWNWKDSWAGVTHDITNSCSYNGRRILCFKGNWGDD